MAIAQGVAKKLSFIKESTWGTVPANSSTWKFLRRVTSDIDVEKDTYESNEIRTDYQISDFRHGGRRASGTISGELSPGTYLDFMSAALRRAPTAVTNLTGLSLTIAGSGPTYTVTRSAGDFLTGGIKAGMVVRITAGSVNANNGPNKNLYVVSVTATVLTVIPGGNGTLTAEGPVASCTISVPGKVNYTPETGHTNDSFSIEHWFSDISLSEVYSGLRVNTLALNLPATGMATVDINLLGKTVTTAGSNHSSSSSAATTSGVCAAVNGVLLAAGSAVGVVTGLTLNYNGGASSVPVVGSNFSPDVFIGRVRWSGQLQALFENATLRDAFLNETATGISVVLYTGNEDNADFVAFSMPRTKLGGARKNDGETGLSLTIPFQAIFNSSGGTGVQTEKTTLWMQDSLAP